MNNTKITCISEFEEAFNLRFAEKCCGICKYGECECDGDATCSHPKRNDTDEDGVPYLKRNVMQMNVCDLWEKKRKNYDN
jgi:hypothetical protein